MILVAQIPISNQVFWNRHTTECKCVCTFLSFIMTHFLKSVIFMTQKFATISLLQFILS